MLDFRSKQEREKEIEDTVRRMLGTVLEDMFLQLNPNKHYLLILPTDIPAEVSREALEPFRDKLNLAVIHADTAKLLELA